MRNRATPAPPPAASAASPPDTEPSEPTRQTKYDELVDVLADGLFDVMMTAPPRADVRRKRR